MVVIKIAILDDWQNVARSSADFASRADLAFFADAFASGASSNGSGTSSDASR
jgi:hypothetical protein